MKTIYKNCIQKKDIEDILVEAKKDWNIFDTPIIWVIDHDDILIVHNDNVLYFSCWNWVEVTHSQHYQFKVWNIIKEFYHKNFKWQFICFERHLDEYKNKISKHIERLKIIHPWLKSISIDYENKEYSYSYISGLSFCWKFNKLIEVIPILDKSIWNKTMHENKSNSKCYKIAETSFYSLENKYV